MIPLDLTAFHLMSLGLGVACTMMALVWVWATAMKNAGIVDVFWAGGFLLLVLLYVFLGEGWLVRKIVLTLMVGASSLRLAWYLNQRFWREFPTEDGRYAVLRTIWTKHLHLMFLGLFLLQGTLMGVLSLPFAMVAKNPIPAFLPVEWVAMGLWLIGFLGETLADKQLQQFKANPNHQGKVCSVGLWRYSRHPNYFFEWVMWVSYFVMGLGVPGGWVTFYVPLLMLFFLTKVTGIAATEAHALKTRGEAYRRYQAETSPFIPWFPKQS